MSKGNPECWNGGFTWDHCCHPSLGSGGNAECWDSIYTFARCCSLVAPEALNADIPEDTESAAIGVIPLRYVVFILSGLLLFWCVPFWLRRPRAGDSDQGASVRHRRLARLAAEMLQSDEPTSDAAQSFEKPRRTSRTGALALATLAAAKAAEAKRLEMRKLEEEEVAMVAQALADNRTLRQSQDQEFQISLLTDELKDLLARRAELHASSERVAASIEEAEQRKQKAEQRLARFGENPRLREEVRVAEASRVEASACREEADAKAERLDALILEKNGLLVALLS